MNRNINSISDTTGISYNTLSRWRSKSPRLYSAAVCFCCDQYVQGNLDRMEELLQLSGTLNHVNLFRKEIFSGKNILVSEIEEFFKLRANTTLSWWSASRKKQRSLLVVYLGLLTARNHDDQDELINNSLFSVEEMEYINQW